MFQNNLCIIPARGGSKRIPCKNRKIFNGKPIIFYSIDNALNSNLFKEICISTDDREIEILCSEFEKITILERSIKNSSDDATLNDVVSEVINHYKKKQVIFDSICLLLPTAPLLTLELFKKSYEYFKAKKLDYLCSVSEYDYPIEKALSIQPDGNISFLNPHNARVNSQKLNSYVHDTGQFYWFKFESGMSVNNKHGYLIPSIYSQDIDTMNDWKVAELKFQILNQSK